MEFALPRFATLYGLRQLALNVFFILLSVVVYGVVTR